jgi:hypothetical protein
MERGVRYLSSTDDRCRPKEDGIAVVGVMEAFKIPIIQESQFG